MAGRKADSLVEASVPEPAFRTEMAVDKRADGRLGRVAPLLPPALVAGKSRELEQACRRDRGGGSIAICVWNRRIVEVPERDPIARHVRDPPIRRESRRFEKRQILAP